MQGRLISTPRYNGMRPDLMNEQIVTTSNDTIVIRDRNDEKGEIQPSETKHFVYFFIVFTVDAL